MILVAQSDPPHCPARGISLAGMGRIQAAGAIAALAETQWPAAPVRTQAEITTVCALRYIRMTDDDLAPVGRYLRLDALMEHCEALPAFVTTYPPDVAYPMGEQGAVR